MSYKDITAGKKIAKPVAARFMKSEKTGSFGFEVAFEFTEINVGKERLNWVGWLTKDAMPYTMDKMVNVLEFNGNDECDDQGVLVDPKAINYYTEVEIVVEIESYNGKHYPKIKFVNRLGGSAFAGCSRESIKGTLEGLGFKAAFLAAKQAKGATQPIPADQLPF